MYAIRMEIIHLCLPLHGKSKVLTLPPFDMTARRTENVQLDHQPNETVYRDIHRDGNIYRKLEKSW